MEFTFTILFFGLILVVNISACGTLTTTTKPDFIVKKDLKARGSKCSHITRVYSGVGYDYCVVMSDPVIGLGESHTKQYVFDFVGSCIADTLILPYTFFLQLNKGNLKLDHVTPTR